MLCDSSIRSTTEADLLFSTHDEKSKGIDFGAADVEFTRNNEPLEIVAKAIKAAISLFSFLRMLDDRIHVSRYFFGSKIDEDH